MTKRKFYFIISGMIVVLFIGAYLSIHIGSVKIPYSATLKAFFNNSGGNETTELAMFETIINEIRLPRVLAAILCGAALSVSGAAYQSMFMNPLVSPALLGVLAGAAFGASLGMILSPTMLAAQIGAFVFGILAVVAALFLSGFFPGNRLVMLIMGGVISSTLFTSLLSVVKYIADTKNELPTIVYWLMGGFSSVTMPVIKICGPILIIGITFIILFSNYLNVLSMGDEEASSLGVNVSKIRNILLIATTLCCSLTVSIGGMISWVGLMIPHISRMIVGHNNKFLILFSALLGSLYLLIVDTLCRGLFTAEIPIGIVTSIIGIPFFIFVIVNTNNRWN